MTRVKAEGEITNMNTVFVQRYGHSTRIEYIFNIIYTPISVQLHVDMFSANIFNDHHMSSTIQIMSCQSIQKVISKFFIFADNNNPNRE